MTTPARSSAADRQRPTLWDALIAVLVLLVAGLLFWSLRPGTAPAALTAEVRLDGVLVGTYPLDQSAEHPVLVEVDAPWPVTLELEPGRVRIAHSDCPSQDCVPHRLDRRRRRADHLPAQPAHPRPDRSGRRTRT